MLYAYCLSDEVTERMLEGVAGVGGFAPRLIDYAGLALVASDFGEATLPVTRENVLAHERVVHRVLAETTPLPFRFGTIASAERFESYVVSQTSSLKAALERVRGAVEMSVKIIWNSEENWREALAGRIESEGSEAGNGAGTRFLQAKRRELMGDEHLKERAEDLCAWLEELLKPFVKASSVQLRPAQSLVLAASHLVERAEVDAYRRRLEDARTERTELRFLTSGPWPPYNFSNLFS